MYTGQTQDLWSLRKMYDSGEIFKSTVVHAFYATSVLNLELSESNESYFKSYFLVLGFLVCCCIYMC